MKKDYITNFDNYVQYILEDNPDFNKDNEYFSIYTKIVNKFEMLVGKKISHFTPDELLECMENYNRGTKKTFRSFLNKYFSYLVIQGEMELNYIQYDKRFEYGNIIEDGIKFISDSRFYKVLENNNLSNEKKAILLALYEGLELKTISKIRKSSIIKKNELVMLGDGECFKKNMVLKIDENEIAVSRNLVEILKSLEFVHTRYSGYKAFPLKCYKDYIFKTVHINKVSKKFESDSQYENYLRKSIGRFIRDDVANLFKCSIDELRISGIVNFVCSNLKEENFQKNKVNNEKIETLLKMKGYKNSGFYWEITYRNLIEDYYNNQGK